jgi:hypothetical protein
MQGLEGDIDTVHKGFLHAGHARLADLMPGSSEYYSTKDAVLHDERSRHPRQEDERHRLSAGRRREHLDTQHGPASTQRPNVEGIGGLKNG